MLGSASNGLRVNLPGSKTEVSEDQRRGLAGGARDREHRRGDDAAERAGQDDASTERQRRRRARRRLRAGCSGTSSRTSWLPRAISGSMMIASATEPANADCLLVGDEQAEDEEADDDRGQAVHQVERELDRGARLGAARTR